MCLPVNSVDYQGRKRSFNYTTALVHVFNRLIDFGFLSLQVVNRTIKSHLTKFPSSMIRIQTDRQAFILFWYRHFEWESWCHVVHHLKTLNSSFEVIIRSARLEKRVKWYFESERYEISVVEVSHWNSFRTNHMCRDLTSDVRTWWQKL